MVVGDTNEDSEATAPVELENGTIEMVDDFTYLGSIITKDGQLGHEGDSRVAKAAKAFGSMRNSIFRNTSLSISAKRKVYQAAILPVMLYGAETWPVKVVHQRRLAGFHNHCVRTILGIDRYDQWQEHITTEKMNEDFGMPGSIKEVVRQHRLRWLGHVARMDANRLPKQILFGELEKTRPPHGTKKRWRDVVKADLQSIGLQEDWYNKAQDRQGWATICRDSLEVMLNTSNTTSDNASRPSSSTCNNTSYGCSCGRHFRRRGDLVRHQRFCGSTIGSSCSLVASFTQR